LGARRDRTVGDVDARIRLVAGWRDQECSSRRLRQDMGVILPSNIGQGPLHRTNPMRSEHEGSAGVIIGVK
jgi:hypothetical protein